MVAAGSAAVDPALAAIWAEVLGVGAPDDEDDFFALGGNSLLATQITARVADALGVDVPLEALFEAPTLGAYAEVVRAATPARRADGNGRGGGLRWLRRGGRGERAGRVGREARTPVAQDALSHLQESAWSVQRYAPDTRPHVGQVFSLQGPLDVGALERALTALVARHEILRTTFPFVDHRPRARVQPAGPVALELVAPAKRLRDEDVRRLVDAAWREPLDPERAPPLRLQLIRTGKTAHVLVFILHEMLCDGQAFDLLVRELSQLYRAEAAGEASALREPAPQYRDVVRAHGTHLAIGDAEAGAAHWREALAGAPLALQLPLDDGRPPSAGSYARRSVQLPAELAGRLRTLAQAESATSFMVHLAAYVALLHRWSGATDVLVKSPTANRARVEWEQIAGFFSMVLPLRVDAGGDPTFRELLRRTREQALAAFRHAASAPEDNMLREVDGLRGIGGWSPLFRLWDPTTEQPLELGDVRAKPYRDDGEGGRLVLVVTERTDGRTVVQLSSSAAEIDARAVADLLRGYERLLTQVAEDPDRRIGSGVALLTPGERDALGGRGGGRGAHGSDTGGGRGLAGVVEDQARRTPDALACAAGDGSGDLTYAELDARAARLAGALRSQGVGPEACVGVAIGPSQRQLVAMLGVLKAGATCVPLLDPVLPGEPLAGLPPLAALVTAGDAKLPAAPAPVVVDLDAVASGGTAASEATGADGGGGEIPADRVALVIRTAGLANGPRAVALTHGTLRRAALRQRDAQRLTARDRVAHVPGRGAWSWALAPWAPLAAGAAVVGPERAPSPDGAASPAGWLDAHDVTVAAMGTTLASAALARAAALPGTLRLLLAQGAGPLHAPSEAVGRGRLAVQRQYGLTETAGAVLSEPVTGDVPGGAPVAGEPSGARALVLDAHDAVAPAGVAGALHLEDGERTIRTGDLARRRADGKLEVFGATAAEVRYRGLRLTPILHAIESALSTHPGVQAAAVCWAPEAAALVGCVVPRRAAAPPRLELDAWLQRTMDDWVLPAAYAAVDAVPRHADGLPDRDALAAAPAVAEALAAHAASPAAQTRTERALAAIWTTVLGGKPGVHDNFFAAGGTLARGAELVSRANAAGIAIDHGDVMYRPTIAELAAVADGKR